MPDPAPSSPGASGRRARPVGRCPAFLVLALLAPLASLAASDPAGGKRPRPLFTDTEIKIEADSIAFTDEGRLDADGNVTLDSSYGLLKAQHLSYSDTSKLVEVEQGFTVTAATYRFTGDHLRLNVAEKKGDFLNVKGSYQSPDLRGLTVYFHSLRGYLEGDSIRIEDARMSNYEPPEKAGAFLRVKQATFYHKGKGDFLLFRHVQIFLFGQKIMAVPLYQRALTPGGPSTFTFGPTFKFHTDSSYIIGANASYGLYKMLRLGGGYAYSLRKGALPSLSLYTTPRRPFEAKVEFGRNFVLNEFGEGTVVRSEPAGSIKWTWRSGSWLVNLSAGGGEVKEQETRLSGSLRWGRGSVQKRLATLGELRVYGQTNWTRQQVELSPDVAGLLHGKTRWISSAWVTQRFRKGWVSFGYLTADKRGNLPFHYLSTRERNTFFTEGKYRLTSRFDFGYQLEYDFIKRNFYRDAYEIGYRYHGVVVHVRQNPRLGGATVYFSVEGL